MNKKRRRIRVRKQEPLPNPLTQDLKIKTRDQKTNHQTQKINRRLLLKFVIFVIRKIHTGLNSVTR
jgi:hypothetical protein